MHFPNAKVLAWGTQDFALKENNAVRAEVFAAINARLLLDQILMVEAVSGVALPKGGARSGLERQIVDKRNRRSIGRRAAGAGDVNLGSSGGLRRLQTPYRLRGGFRPSAFPGDTIARAAVAKDQRASLFVGSVLNSATLCAGEPDHFPKVIGQ